MEALTIIILLLLLIFVIANDNKTKKVVDHLNTLVSLKKKELTKIERIDELLSEIKSDKKQSEPVFSESKLESTLAPKFAEIKDQAIHDVQLSQDEHEHEELVQENLEPIIEEELSPVESINHVVSYDAEEEQKELIEESISEPIQKTESSIISPIVSKDKTQSPKEKTMKLRKMENFFSENLLSKIGIVTLVLGIGFFIKYAIDQDWINEIGRVAVGFLLGALIIGVAHKLKENYRTFSSILVGGGISVFYITVTFAFREYQLFSFAVAFGLLVLITSLSVFLSLTYDKKELAIFSLLGGFCSPLLLSTGSDNYVLLFLYFLVLNTGMLMVAYRRNWPIIGIISFVLTQCFWWFWIRTRYEFDNATGAMLFSFLFFLQFYFLSIISHIRASRSISWSQVVIILGSNLSLLGTCFIVFDDFPQYKGLCAILLALLNAIPLIVLFKSKQVDKRFIYLLIAVVLSCISLAVPLQLGGSLITMFWAVETVILLWLFQKSGIEVFRSGFFLIQLLVFISLFMDMEQYHAKITLSIITNPPFITGLIVVGSMVFNLILLKKEDQKSVFKCFNVRLVSMPNFIRVQRISCLFLAYLVPFIEIKYQLDNRCSLPILALSLGIYTYAFIAIFTAIKWKNGQHSKALVNLLVISCIVFLNFALNMIHTRYDMFHTYVDSSSYFAIHFLYIPAMVVILSYLWKRAQIIPALSFTRYTWVLVIYTAFLISLEADNVAVLFFANQSNYSQVIGHTHTIVYPVLWAVIALICMFKGLKKRNATLRKIALALFSLVILKFYLFDLWSMDSKGGKIISFIALGVILLSASFVFQRVKKFLQVEDDLLSISKQEVDSTDVEVANKEPEDQ